MKPNKQKTDWKSLTYKQRRNFALSNGIRPTGTWQPNTQKIYEGKPIIKRYSQEQVDQLLNSQREEIIKDLKENFEANVLDGDKLEDCGKAMISSEAILDWLQSLKK